MNAKVFINYRREDTAHAAGRVYDRLAARFGEHQVLIDIDQIEPGEDFVEAINRKVSACDIAIVAIGPNWLRATDPSGKRRLDDEEDFVRMEIVAALQRNIRVIPVLVGGARMPAKHDLPEPLAPLSRRNAIELSETRFHADVSRLIEAIEKSFAVREKKPELSATPAAPPMEPATVSPPEPESRDRMTPVKSTQVTPASPPVPSTSLIAALKRPEVWTIKRMILVSAIVLLLAGLAWFLMELGHQKAAKQSNQTKAFRITPNPFRISPNPARVTAIPAKVIAKPATLSSPAAQAQAERTAAPTESGKQVRVGIRPLKRTYIKVTVGDKDGSPTFDRWVSPADGPVEFHGKHVWIRVLDPDAVQITKNGEALRENDEDVTVN
jgi:hypothetical protein